MAALVEMRLVNKWYGSYHALHDVTLDVHAGERLAICGPSGSGKSTLIRCLNGLESYSSGTIRVAGHTLDDDPARIQAVRRDVGIVFQQFHLFPHLTVLENCTLAPVRVKRLTAAQAADAALYYLDRVKVADQAHKYPSALSGGQQQRVAIARALAMSPKVLMLDEPTSALDPATAGEVLTLIHSIADEGRTVLCVTHDVAFARGLAGRVVHMNAGTLEESTRTVAFSAR